MPSLPVGRPSNWEHLDPPTDPEALTVPVLSSDPADEGKALDAYSGAPLALESSSGSSSAGDRARMALDGTFDSDLFVFPADFDDPQPNDADVPVGWSVVDGGLLLPAGAYWVRANWGGTMTENGGVLCWPAFITDYNGSGAWGADADASTAVTDGQGISVYARGIVYTPVADTLYLCSAGSAMATATNINGSMLVTRIA